MLTLTNLEYFRESVAKRSVLQASRRLHVSPSAISRAIRCLEDHFGTELLKHQKKQFILTEEGWQLYRLSESLAANVERVEEAMRFARDGVAGTVFFASQQSLAQHLLPGYLAYLVGEYPRLMPRLRIGSTKTVRQWLDDREVAFALSMDHFQMSGFSALKVFSGKFIFVATKAVAKDRVRRFMLTDPTPETRQFEIAFEKRYGQKPMVAMVVESWGVLKHLASEGMGIALIPDYLVRFDSDSRLVEVKLDLPPVEYSVNVYFDERRGELSRVSANALDLLMKYVKMQPRH